MGNFLISLAGAHRVLLDQVPTERVRFQSLGWALLITAGIAAISMWFALTSALGLNSFLAFPMAVLWGLIILGIDRWLVTSMPLASPGRWAVAVPRLLLSLLLGTLISTPFVLRIFQSEINAQITVIQSQRANTFLQEAQHSQSAMAVTRLNSEVTNLQNVISSGGAAPINPASDPDVKALTTQRTQAVSLQQTYYAQWQCQLYGGSGCTVPKGNGPLAQAAHATYVNETQQVNSLNQQILNRESALEAASTKSRSTRLAQARSDLPSVQAQLMAAKQRQQGLLANFAAANASDTGLLIRLQALGQLAGSDAALNAARFLLFLLFLVIECLPVTVKLLQRPGTYERVLDEAAASELREARRAYRLRPRSASVEARLAAELPGTPAARQLALRDIWRIPDPAHGAEPAATEPVPSGETETDALLMDMALRQMPDSRSVIINGSSGIELRYGDDDL